jgi:hypothetical protein
VRRLAERACQRFLIRIVPFGWSAFAQDTAEQNTRHTPATIPRGTGEIVFRTRNGLYGRQRTSAALAELKDQGVKLGRPTSIPDASLSRLVELREDGMSYRAMADQLNAEDVPTGQGGQWHHTTVYPALQCR